MRACLLSVLLLALVGASAYTIWQIHLLRAAVNDIRSEMAQERESERESLIEHARNAIEALGRGELERAEAELDRLGELAGETRTLAAEQRQRLQQLLAEAKDAVARGSSKASDIVEDLRDYLMHAPLPGRNRQTAEEGEDRAAEP